MSSNIIHEVPKTTNLQSVTEEPTQNILAPVIERIAPAEITVVTPALARAEITVPAAPAEIIIPEAPVPEIIIPEAPVPEIIIPEAPAEIIVPPVFPPEALTDLDPNSVDFSVVLEIASAFF